MHINNGNDLKFENQVHADFIMYCYVIAFLTNSDDDISLDSNRDPKEDRDQKTQRIDGN